MIRMHNIIFSNLKKKLVKIKFSKINKTKKNFFFLKKNLKLNILKNISPTTIKINYLKNKNNIFLFYKKINGRIH